jgi:hypothetical protein
MNSHLLQARYWIGTVINVFVAAAMLWPPRFAFARDFPRRQRWKRALELGN